MRGFKANECPHFLTFPLTDERYRPVWLVAYCMLGWERSGTFPDGIFTKQWNTMKLAAN